VPDIAEFRPSKEILQMVSAIDEFKGAWRAFRTIAPELLSALRRVATIESVRSSTRIEGVKLTNSEVERLLSGQDTGSYRARDEEEVAGYAAVVETVFANYEHLPLTENHVKQLHGILLRHSGKGVRHRGHYKTYRIM
jgi:Fic family protein